MIAEPAWSPDAIGALERRLLPSLLANAHPAVRAWRASALEDDQRTSLRQALISLGDDEAARKFSEQMRALALPPRVFKSRVVEIAGASIVACINFRDVSGDFPFVRVLAASEPLVGLRDRPALTAALKEAFSEFGPSAALFYQPAHVPLAGATAGIDDHLLAAPAGDMAALPPPRGLDRVHLRPARHLDFYPRYVAAYEATYAARPALRGEVRTESEASLAECLAAGHLYEVLVDGTWAGVLAAKTRTLEGLHGLYMIEIVLGPEARGQRLGPAVHYRLATAVAANDPKTVILGTISSKNPWSLQAASRAGRIEIGAWHWIGL